MIRTFFLAAGIGFAALFANDVQAQSATDSVVIATSAKCGMCKQTIEQNLKFARGVSRANLDVKTKQLTVWYAAGKTNPAAIRKAVAAAGYDADEVPADPKAHDQLEPCCQKSAAAHDD